MKIIYCRRPKLLIMGLILLCLVLIGMGICMPKAVSTTGEEAVSLPIIMYHSILKDPARAGKFVVSPSQLEQDLIYLQENGYQTIFVSDLVAYVEQGTPLPEKPVIISLDDGYLNNKTYGLPLLEQYDMKAVVSIVGSYSQHYTDIQDPRPSYAYLTWSDIQEMAESGHFEFGNHTYAFHGDNDRQGILRKTGEDMVVYQSIIEEDIMKNQDALLEFAGIECRLFTYPFGASDAASDQIIRELGFAASFSCYEKLNWIRRDPDCLYGLGRFNRPSGVSTESFMARLLP